MVTTTSAGWPSLLRACRRLPRHIDDPCVPAKYFLLTMPFIRDLILLLLLCAGIHPNPGPVQADNPKSLLQFNCNGIFKAKAELLNFLNKYQVKVACIQETKLTQRSKSPLFQNYNVIRKDRPRGGGGGLAILVHHTVRFTDIDTSFMQNDLTLEIMGIQASINNTEINIFNVYIPPASSCPPGYTSDLSPILSYSDSDTFILGDLNAHHESWSTLSDIRGATFIDQIENSSFVFLNTESSTRCPTNGNLSSPDLSLASAHLALAVIWQTEVQLNSDHLPISISFLDDLPNIRTTKTYTNFHKANWAQYVRESENLFEGLPLPRSCAKGEKIFRDIVLTASKHSIPSGFQKSFSPGLPREAKNLMEQRDSIRSRDPHDPEITRLNQEISKTGLNHPGKP